MKIKKNDIIIKDSCSIKNAIRAINSGGLQICFVVNYKNILKGLFLMEILEELYKA